MANHKPLDFENNVSRALKDTQLINNIQSEVQKSATSTLESISRAFGAENVEFKFTTKTATEVEVAVSEDLAASA